MNRKEKREIAVCVRTIVKDNCDEIRNAYKAKFGSLKGLRDYVRKECIEFWSSEANPYLDKEYIGYCYIRMEDGTIINLDDIWCFIRDCLKEQ